MGRTELGRTAQARRLPAEDQPQGSKRSPPGCREREGVDNVTEGVLPAMASVAGTLYPNSAGRDARHHANESLVFAAVALLHPRGFARSEPVKRILVIDDDARLREQYIEILRLEGYEVSEARNGREGVERARKEPPDLVLCDITMPEMNGHRVLETLRGEARTAHIPFVFLTGWNEREDIRTGMNLGADDYLTKPVVPDELTATIRARLRRAELASAAGGRKKPASEATPSQLESLGLTPREAEVLFWVARGKTNDEIATVLSIGLTTVKKHLESTYAKLGVENRTTAAAMALEQMGTG